MGKTTLTPNQYHEAVSILVSQFDEALERRGLEHDVYARHETLGDTIYTHVTVCGTKPKDETVNKTLYFLAGFANCGLGRGHRRGDFTLKRKIS